MALALASELAEWLGAETPTGAEATRAELCLEAASDKVESICGQRFTLVTEARTVSPPMLHRELLTDPFQSLTLVETRPAVSVAFEELAATGYETHRTRTDRPYNRLLRTDGGYWPSGPDVVRLTGTWGQTTPEGVKLAVIMAAANLFQSNQSPTGALADYDGTTIPSIFGYDQRILQLLDSYKSGKWFF